MDDRYELKKREKTELRLYRLLGVKQFQSCAFALERWKHRKDGGWNSNYHFRQLSYAGISAHFSYLSYNGLIHEVSLFVLLVHLLVTHLISYSLGLWNVVIVFLLLTNLYCIFLQRYNALRFRQYQLRYRKRYEERVRKKAGLLSEHQPEDYPEEQRKKDLSWLSGMRDAIREGSDFLIREEDADAMTRLCHWAQAACVTWKSRRRESRSSGTEKQEEQLRRRTALYTKADIKAQWLSDRFHKADIRLLQTYAVLTAGEKSECAFSELFPDDSREGLMEVLDTFLYP